MSPRSERLPHLPSAAFVAVLCAALSLAASASYIEPGDLIVTKTVAYVLALDLGAVVGLVTFMTTNRLPRIIPMAVAYLLHALFWWLVMRNRD